VTSRIWLVALALGFGVLATANSGGYRYGVSDQAFYAVAIAERADPSLFPLDKPLLVAQSRLWLGDDLLGGIARLADVDLPTLFLLLYALTLAVLCTSAIGFMRALGASSWSAAGFVLLLTLKHQITKTGANTLEGYMHPRILAFAFGLGALACLLRRRRGAAFALVAIAAVLHTTTALWFGIAAAAACIVDIAAVDARRRLTWPVAGAIGAASIAAAVWAVSVGPLAGRLVTMDAAWLRVIDTKDYLFPDRWPWYAWAINFAYPVLIVLTYRARLRRGIAAPAEGAVVAGLLCLVAIFAVAVPLTAWRVALAVQMQVNRVFWLLDVVAIAYGAWWLLDARVRSSSLRPAAIGALLTISAARGFYVVAVEAGRPLLDVRPDSDWSATLSWIGAQPGRWHVLADPEHAWKHGLSVRVGAHRDTLLESSKDSAIAIYDRAIAMRVADRGAALDGFDRFTASEFRAIAARYDADVLVIERDPPLDLPVLHRQGPFTVYDLRQ
jgi:hypothetical protein